MTNVVFLAQFWGWLTLIVAAVFFLRPDQLRQLKLLMIQNRGFSLAYGFMSLILGIMSVVLYNRWSLSWTVIVSLFGWLALLKGVYVLAFNEISEKPSLEARLASTRIALVIVGLLGLFMIAASMTTPAG